jgi:hypothetical protein
MHSSISCPYPFPYPFPIVVFVADGRRLEIPAFTLPQGTLGPSGNGNGNGKEEGPGIGSGYNTE